MAIKLQNKPNVIPVGGSYPYGDIKDDDGSGNGTPVNRLVYADLHQFFAKMMDVAAVVFNGLPDNVTNGFQLFTALNTIISTAVASEATLRTTADTTLQTNITSEASARSSADTVLQTNINAKAAIVQTPWANLTLINGWVAGSVTPQYFKDNFGCVHLRGSINGAGNSNVVFANLPAGNRPATTFRKLVNYSSPNVLFVNIDTGGNADATDGAGSGGTYSLDDINLWTI